MVPFYSNNDGIWQIYYLRPRSEEVCSRYTPSRGGGEAKLLGEVEHMAVPQSFLTVGGSGGDASPGNSLFLCILTHTKQHVQSFLRG